MVGWHHQPSGHEFEQTLGDNEGQGSLVCCSPWSCEESDMTEQLNNNQSATFRFSSLLDLTLQPRHQVSTLKSHPAQSSSVLTDGVSECVQAQGVNSLVWNIILIKVHLLPACLPPKHL